MRMQQLTERVWLFPKEDERDRPVLGYVRGDRWSLAVDAGHSDAHVEDFYHALEEEGLPLPELTVLTHWHWDHTFGLHAIQGLSVANVLTNEHLRDYRDMIERNGADVFLDQYESIRVEYAGNRPVKIVTSDLEFSGKMMFDAGGCRIRVFQADAPHTDDSTFIEVIDDGVLFIGDAILVPRILINWHIRLSDCPYAASSSIGNARIASFGFIAYEQSSCVNVPEIYYSVY